MSNSSNGGPAFPCEYEGSTRSDAYGMTLRDYFAAKAMQAMTTNPYWDDKDYPNIAEHAYKQADAMLAERERRS